jgi:hypothetical protein
MFEAEHTPTHSESINTAAERVVLPTLYQAIYEQAVRLELPLLEDESAKIMAGEEAGNMLFVERACNELELAEQGTGVTVYERAGELLPPHQLSMPAHPGIETQAVEQTVIRNIGGGFRVG